MFSTGKFIENVFGYTKVVVVLNERKRLKYANSPYLTCYKLIADQMMLMFLKPNRVYLNKPIRYVKV